MALSVATVARKPEAHAMNQSSIATLRSQSQRIGATALTIGTPLFAFIMILCNHEKLSLLAAKKGVAAVLSTSPALLFLAGGAIQTLFCSLVPATGNAHRLARLMSYFSFLLFFISATLLHSAAKAGSFGNMALFLTFAAGLVPSTIGIILFPPLNTYWTFWSGVIEKPDKAE